MKAQNAVQIKNQWFSVHIFQMSSDYPPYLLCVIFHVWDGRDTYLDVPGS